MIYWTLKEKQLEGCEVRNGSDTALHQSARKVMSGRGWFDGKKTRLHVSGHKMQMDTCYEEGTKRDERMEAAVQTKQGKQAPKDKHGRYSFFPNVFYCSSYKNGELGLRCSTASISSGIYVPCVMVSYSIYGYRCELS